MTPDAAAPPPSADARWLDYDYALLRVVPRVCVGAYRDVGVVLHARRARFLEARILDVTQPDVRADLARWAPADFDLDLLTDTLAAYGRVARAEGGLSGSGPIGRLPPSERFHWLVAVRSSAVQASPVHVGRAQDLDAEVERLYRMYVGG
jgi:hypothetical protein